MTFTVVATDKVALEKAIKYINHLTGSDYLLVKHVLDEVGLGTIEVTQEKVKPEFLFLMGQRYSIFHKHLKINFSTEEEE